MGRQVEKLNELVSRVDEPGLAIKRKVPYRPFRIDVLPHQLEVSGLFFFGFRTPGKTPESKAMLQRQSPSPGIITS